MTQLLVGLDIGTTRTKAGVVDVDGRELTRAAVPTTWRPGPHGDEASTRDFAAAARAALGAALAQAPAGEVLAVGVTSIAETVVIVDADGGEVIPSIAWYERRAADDHARMREALGEGEVNRHTGLVGDAIPTIAVLHRLATEDPATLRRARHVLSVAEWVVHDLGGAIASEPSLASRTGALSVPARTWWEDALGWAGLSPEVMAPLRDAGASWGAVRSGAPELARLRGAVLTVAGHDHLTAAVGSGLTGSRQVMDSCGTAEALLRPIAADPARDLAADVARGVNCGWHALPGHLNLIVGLRLGLDLVPLLERLHSSSAAGETPLDAGALAWLQDDRRGEPPTAVRQWAEAIERAVAAARHALDELQELGGPIDQVLIGGGWAANPVLRRCKQSLFPDPTYPLVTEPGVRGAALLAGQAAGVFADPQAFPPPPTHRIPDTEEIPVP